MCFFFAALMDDTKKFLSRSNVPSNPDNPPQYVRNDSCIFPLAAELPTITIHRRDSELNASLLRFN